MLSDLLYCYVAGVSFVLIILVVIEIIRINKCLNEGFSVQWEDRIFYLLKISLYSWIGLIAFCVGIIHAWIKSD